MNRPLWNPSEKSASIRKWAEELHKESKRVFLLDKTHAHLLFLFKDEGPVGINPIPPKTDQAQIYEAIRRAVKDNNLYAVIYVGEVWTYFLKHKKDHTAFQLLDGEMKVSDLRDEDKTEALYLKMESRDGASLIYLDKIVRDKGQVGLGDGKTIEGEDLKWFGLV
jgi:hypothetical protein